MSDELPNGWSLSSLGQIVTLRGEKVSPALSPEEPYLGLEDIEPHTARILRYSRAGDFKSAAARFYPGDILYSRLRPYLNKVALAECAGLASAELLALRAAEGINKGFLLRRIMAADFLEFTASLDRGDRPRVDYDQISAFPIKLPPSDEQERVGEKIDSLFARSSRARDELAHIPKLIDRYRQAVLEAAFRGDLTADWRKISPNLADPTQTVADLTAQRTKTGGKRASLSPPAPDTSEIFPLPDDLPWHRTTLEQVCHQSRGIPYGIIQTGKQFDGGVPTVRCGDIKNFGIDLSILKQVDPVIASEYERTRLKGGEVLIAIRGSVGETAVVPPTMVGMNISREVAMVPVLPAMNAAFICYLLASPHGASFLARHTKGVAQTGINLSDLRAFPVPIPSAAEQAEIVRKIEQQFLAVERIVQEASLAASRISRLDQSILDKAFSGQLVPQDPADEPASKLLERIQVARAAAPRAKRGRKPKG